MDDLFSNYEPDEAMRMSALIAGFLKGTLSEAEHTELDDWVDASDENMLIFETLTDPDNLGDTVKA